MIRSFAVLSLLVFAAPAAAQDCEGPPGTAAIEQYCESVPDATGNRSTRKGENRNDTRGETRSNDRPAPRVAEPTLQEIENAGPQGEELGRVLRGGEKPAGGTSGGGEQSRAEKGEKREGESGGAGGKRDEGACGDDARRGGGADDPCTPQQRTPEDTPVPVQTGSAFSAVGAAVTGGDTVGGTFPLILLAIAGLIGGAGFIRRGRGGR